MNIFSKLALWIEHLFHLDKAGQLPDPPSVTGQPVTVPVLAAAPVSSSAPAVVSASPAAAPAAPAASTYPAVDADGCIKPSAFVGTPLENYRCMIQDTYEQAGVPDTVKANLLSNFDENFGIRILDNSSDAFSISGITEGHSYLVPRMQPSNNPPSYGDVLVFPAKNTANGWPGFRLVDCPAFVAHCAASGKWPKIDHTGHGAVA